MKYYLVLLSAFSLFPRELLLAIVPNLIQSIQYFALSVDLSVGVFTIGSGVSQLVIGGIGDLVNKKKLLISGALFIIVGNILYYLSINSLVFLGTRFLVGIGSGIFTVLIRVIVIQAYDKKQSLSVMSLISMSTTFFPLIAPMIGTFVLYQYGMAWNFNFCIFIGLISLYCVFRMQFNSKNSEIPCKQWFSAGVKNLICAFRNRAHMPSVFSSAILFGCGIGYLTISTFVLKQQYRIDPRYLGLCFIPVALGYFFGAMQSLKFHYSFKKEKKIKIAFGGLIFVFVMLLLFQKNFYVFEVFIFMFFFISGLYIPYLSQASIADSDNPSAKSSVLGFIRTFISLVYAVIASKLCVNITGCMLMFLVSILLVSWLLRKVDAY